MVLREVTIVLGILGFCCSGSFAVNCYDKTSLLRAQRQCFTSQGLQMNIGSQELQNTVQNDPEFVCQNKERYRPALRCALAISRRCIVQLGQNPDIIPDADRAMDGLNYVCNNIHSLNSTCAKDKKAALQACVVNKAMSGFPGVSSLDVVKITCKAFEITVDCLKESLASCSGRTKDILVRYTQTYLTPTACGNRYSPVRVSTTKTPLSSTTKSPLSSTTTSPVWMTTMAPVSTFTLVTGMPSLPHASCYDKDSLQAAQQSCFSQEGLHMVLPEITLGNGQQTKQSYLDALMSNNRDFRSMCRNQLAQYQRAMWCAMEVARQCMPYGYKGYLPSGRQVQGLLVDLCNNVDDINQTCVVSKASDLFDCGYRKGLSLRGRDTKSLLCSVFKFNAECQKEELRSCGCKTASLYVRMSKEHLNPSSCPAIDVVPDDCSLVSNKVSVPTTKSPVSSTTTSPVWMTTMAPVSSFMLVTGMPSLPHASCHDKDSIQAAQQSCYSKEGLHVVLPEITLGNGQRTKQSYLDALMSNSKDFKSMCRNQLAQYQRAMWCAMEVARQCMPDGYKGYLPSGRQVQGLLVDLCNNVDDINQTCVVSKASDLFDCGYRKGLSLRGRDVKSLLCSAFKFNAVCQKEELQSCGCKTASLYVRMSKEHLNPSSCPAIDVVPDDCSLVSNKGDMQIGFKPLGHSNQQNGNKHRGSGYYSYEHLGNQRVHDQNAATTSRSAASIGLLAIGTLLAYRIFM